MEPRPEPNDPRALSRRKSSLFAAASLGLSASLCFLVLESASRWLENRDATAKTKPADALNMMQANPAGTGSYRLRPGLRIATTVKARGVEVRTNSHGMRWREVTREKRGRTKRVAFLGDSFTFGCWADTVEDSFVGVFERLANPRRFEVLNFGVGGYGLDDEELLLKEEVTRFSPDFVVVGLFGANDFRDTFLGLRKYDLLDGTVRLNQANLEQRIPEAFRRNDAVFSVAAEDPSAVRRGLKRLASFRLLLPLAGWDNLALDFRVSQRFTSFTFWSQHPLPKVALEAKDDVLATLGRMNAFAAEKGATLAVVAIPSRDQVYSRRESGPGFDIGLPQVYVQVFAREQGVPYLDLLPRLRTHVAATNEDLFVGDDIHFNDRGHFLVGQAIHEWFVREVKPRGDR